MRRLSIYYFFILLTSAVQAQTHDTLIVQRGFVSVQLEAGVLSMADSGYARLFKSRPIFVQGFAVSFGRKVCLSLGYSSYEIEGPTFSRYNTQGKFVADSAYSLANSQLHLTLLKYIDVNDYLALRMRAGVYRNNGTLTLRRAQETDIAYYSNYAFLIGGGLESPLTGALCLYLDANYLYSADVGSYIYNTGGLQLNAGFTFSFL